jgi:hypothetical protein
MKDWEKEWKKLNPSWTKLQLNFIRFLLAEQKEEIEDKMNFEFKVGKRANKNVIGDKVKKEIREKMEEL